MTIGRNAQAYIRVGLLLFIIFGWLAAPVSAQQPPTDDPQPAPFDPRFGIVDSFVNTAEANAAGAGWTRAFFRWDVVQPGGPSDWKPANVPDTFIDAEVAAGREVVAVLIGTPSWATESGVSTAVPPREYWGDFVYKIAAQYQGRIKHWVIWNQPDIDDPASPGRTWDGAPEDYYLLLKEAYLKIKAVDPAMQVHLAGLTYTWDQERGNRQYLARLLDAATADPEAANNNYFFDAVSYHLYYDPRQMFQTLADIRSILNDYGLTQKPIWINETNAPPTEDFIEPATASTALEITLEEQSAFVIQAFALSLAGGAERIAFNKLRNEGDLPAGLPYGLLRSDNSRRPAFDAFKTVTTHFAGVQQATRQQLGNVDVVTLDRGEQTTTVLWNTGSAPLNFNLNAIAAEALLVDEGGNSQTIAASNGLYSLELPGAVCSSGANCAIGGPPRLIIEAGSPAQRAALQPPAAAPTTAPAPDSQPTATPALAETTEITETAEAPPSPPTPIAVAQQPAQVITPTAQAAPPSAAETPPPALDVLPDPGIGGDGAPPADVLPDPDFEALAPGAEIGEDPSSTPTIVPQVTVATVLRPARLLWLFIIGLVVFTITYGVQVAIWYRLKR